MIAPVTATTKPAPADTYTSLTLMVNPSGRPSFVWSSELVKYDAFNEMGGKLSFSLAMLDVKNNGFIINAMHTREGCYTYIKEIIDGNSVIVLSGEEQEALNNAMGENNIAK